LKEPSRFGEFIPTEPRTEWLTHDAPDRRMRMLERFVFRDRTTNTDWETPKDYCIDGASIPSPLWGLVGSPFVGDYRRATIVHDKACDDANRSPRRHSARLAADKMFFRACIVGGCTVRQSILLYIGVRIGAYTPFVVSWKTEEEIVFPRLERTREEERVEAAFQTASRTVLQLGETDDVDELERRVRDALQAIAGAILPG
jgi:Protein of unknown function (DUF1353)